MEQLLLLLSARFKRVQEVTQSLVEGQQFRLLKEQQRMRTEKQNFILNMLKTSKGFLSSQNKQQFFDKSLAMMQVIDKEFNPERPSTERIVECFLDSFVGLYREFFDRFADTFQFKTHVKNFLRPTNHNVVSDLIRYLVDFSRDYYQQTFIWHAKNRNKADLTANRPTAREEDNNTVKSGSVQKFKKLKPLFQAATFTEIPDNDILIKKRKKDIWRNYNIMSIQVPQLNTESYLGPNNIDIVRVRVNQMYRDMKMRNSTVKVSIEKYRMRSNKAEPLGSQKQITWIGSDSDNSPFPYNFFLVLERNGYSSINIEEKRKVLGRNEFNSNKPLGTGQMQNNTQGGFLTIGNSSNPEMPGVLKHRGSEYLLSSLKILRITDNFLPPLVFNRMRQERPIPKTVEEEPVLSRRPSLFKVTSSIPKNVRYFNEESGESGFKSTRGSQTNRSNTKGRDGEQVQEKLLDWLNKIKNVKQLQKNKLMSMKGQ